MILIPNDEQCVGLSPPTPTPPGIGLPITDALKVGHVQALTFSMHICSGTMTTQAESINSDQQRGLDRRLRHTQHRTEPVSH